MRTDAEATTGAVWATPGQDPRVTKVGAVLRRSRIDELPQLWNVLRGEMSLVGPRPERPEFVSMLTEQIPFYGQRHAVRPGLTGWAQVRYAYGASVEDAMEKLQYDLYYIKNRSIALDVYIIFETAEDGRHAKRVVTGRRMAITLPRHAEIWLPDYLRSRARARREASRRERCRRHPVCAHGPLRADVPPAAGGCRPPARRDLAAALSGHGWPVP